MNYVADFAGFGVLVGFLTHNYYSRVQNVKAYIDEDGLFPSDSLILKQPMVERCIFYHSKNGANHPWLEPMFGKLEKVEFSYKDGEWVDQESFHQTVTIPSWHTWWVEHKNALSHNYEDLAASHEEYFIGPDRSLTLRYIFDDGSVYDSENDPEMFTIFFQLEQAFAVFMLGKDPTFYRVK